MCALPLVLLFSGTQHSSALCRATIGGGPALSGKSWDQRTRFGTEAFPARVCGGGRRDSVWARAPAHSLRPDHQSFIYGRQKARHCTNHGLCRLCCDVCLSSGTACLPQAHRVRLQMVPCGFLPAPLFATGARERDWTVRCVYSAHAAGVKAAPLLFVFAPLHINTI